MCAAAAVQGREREPCHEGGLGRIHNASLWVLMSVRGKPSIQTILSSDPTQCLLGLTCLFLCYHHFVDPQIAADGLRVTKWQGSYHH